MSEAKERIWKIEWAHGVADIHAQGGMLGPVRFRMPNGCEFQPMHAVNWKAHSFDATATGGFSQLYGEWPCVPFGNISAPAELPVGWLPKILDNDTFFHGFASHNDWQIDDIRSGYIALNISYPDESPIDSLQREIEGNPDSPALTVALRIRARRKVAIPVALHATFRIPETGFVRISGGDFVQVHSYPWPLEHNSRIKANTRSRNLSAVEGVYELIDLSSLPLPFPTEELVQLEACNAPIRLDYESEGASVILDWDRKILPDALLWVSNGGRSSPPWNNAHFALGVEPVAGPFDLGRVAAPVKNHPLSNRLLRITPDQESVICYRISASATSSLAKG